MNKLIGEMKGIRWSGRIAILLSFCMPLFPKMLPALLVVLFLSVLLDINKLKFHKEFQSMTWLFALTYLFYVFGLLSSNHIADGLFTLEIKLAFLLLPLFFLFHGPFHIITLRWIFFCFIAGCFINTFFGFYLGYQCYLEKKWWECFFTGFISFNFHTTYLAIYFCFSILVMVYFLINYFSRINRGVIILLCFLILYFSGFVVMLSSKGGMIALATVLFVSMLYFFYKKGSLRSALIILSATGGLMIVLFLTSDYAKIRFSEAFKIYRLDKKELFDKYKETTETTAIRLMIWDVAGDIISKHPFGVGTGDSKYELLKAYDEKGMTGAIQHNLNCHNQFFETTLAIGVHGLIVLIIFLLYILITAIRKRNFLLLWIAVIVILNLFFESMFETQAGVIFFVFFTGLLLTSVPEVIPISDDE